MRRLGLKLGFFLSAMLMATSLHAQPTPPKNCLQVGFFVEDGTQGAVIMMHLLKRMYKVAGLCMNPIRMPSKRSAQMLITGKLDGEMARAGEIQAEYKQKAILVPQPILRVNFQLAWLDNNNFDGTLIGLKGQNVGMLAGQIWASRFIEPFAGTITELNDLKSAAELLERGHIDVLASDSVSQVELQRKFPAQNSPLRVKILRQVDIYHVLHVSQIDKAERLALAIKTMLRSGELDKFNGRLGLERPEIHH